MKYFLKIADEIDVSELSKQLNAQPELWNEHQERLVDQGGPFAGTSDIWVRYRAREELVGPQSLAEPHFAVFYPAWYALPALHSIVFDLMTKTKAVYLGGILVTKIPAGGVIKPHHDRGSWHAEKMNTKIYLGIQSNPECVNYCGDEKITIAVGDAVVFNNQIMHSVENNGNSDRITAIICLMTQD